MENQNIILKEKLLKKKKGWLGAATDYHELDTI